MKDKKEGGNRNICQRMGRGAGQQTTTWHSVVPAIVYDSHDAIKVVLCIACNLKKKAERMAEGRAQIPR